MTDDQKNDDMAQCVYCMHWKQGTCSAYPAGVPYAILANKVDHRQPYPLDRHIHFRANSPDGDRKQRALVAHLYVPRKPSLWARMTAKIRFW